MKMMTILLKSGFTNFKRDLKFEHIIKRIEDDDYYYFQPIKMKVIAMIM